MEIKSNPVKEYNTEIYEDECIIQTAEGSHDGTIIWLHHIYKEAIDAAGFFMKGPALELKNMRFVLPQAKSRIITADSSKTPTPSWFDVIIRGFNKPVQECLNVKDVEESVAQIEAIIDREVELLNGQGEKVFIGGFAQGAAMALAAGLQSKHKLGGIFAAHGYFISASEISDSNKDTPVLVLLGKRPPFRPWDKPDGFYPMAEKTFDQLKSRKSTNTCIELLEQDVYYEQPSIQQKLLEFVNSR